MKQEEWHQVRLGDYCSKIGSGSTPRGGEKVYQSEGIALIRSQNVYNGSFTTDGLVFLGEEEAAKLDGVTVEKDDLLLNITGDSVARCCQVPESVLPARVNQHVSIIRPNPEGFDGRFLKYFLISPYMQAKMLSFAGNGGTRKALTKEMIKNFQVPKPRMSVQKNISEVLSAYDDLIENNRRRIQLLEDAARLLYKEWFVNLRFPGHEHVKVKDGVPEGWKRETISSLCDSVSYGYTASAAFENIGPKYLRITDIVPSFIDWSAVPNCEIPENKKEQFLLQTGDIVVARTGATVGYAKRIHKRYPETVFASYLVRLRPKKNIDDTMLGIFVESDDYKSYIMANAGGAAQPNANAKVIGGAAILVPPRPLQDSFRSIVEPLLDQRDVLRDQVEKLSRARDLLLPKLMSGEIAV